MRRNLQVFALAALFAVSAFGQDRSLWRTAADIREGVRGSIVASVIDLDAGRNQATLQSEDDRYGRITLLTDSVSSQYNGFGGVINDSPEIFTGTSGFSNLRVGDRIEVRGTGRGVGILMADQVTLLGRPVAAQPVGVGGTRTPTSVSTPTPNATADVYGRVEGVVRQINLADNRLVVETDRRELFTVRTASGTPVYYQNEVYQVRNLEVGDRIRVESDGGSTSGRDITARTIDVVQSKQDLGPSRTTARVSSITGRVTRVDPASDMARIDTGRGEVRVDMARAADATGERVRATDLRVGENVEISGSYSSTSDIFVASTIRPGENVLTPGEDDDEEVGEFVTVTLQGTITESLRESAMLTVRDRKGGKVVRIFVTTDFIVRAKNGSYVTADQLATGDSVIVKAYRDGDGNHVAQTIRQR